MHCWTLHSTNQLTRGIKVRKVMPSKDVSAWAIGVGNTSPVGVYEEFIIPEGKNLTFIRNAENTYDLAHIGIELGWHLVKVNCQSPKHGAWSFMKSEGVEIMASGFIPDSRTAKYCNGCEFLVEMRVGSNCKIAICSKGASKPKNFWLIAYDTMVVLREVFPGSTTSLKISNSTLFSENKKSEWPK